LTFKEQEQVLKYRTDTIGTEKHTKRFSHTTGPATCPLCGGSDSAPHILLRCNNHTLKRMHINRHHHAVSLCGEEISKGKLGSAIVTMVLVTVKSYLTFCLVEFKLCSDINPQQTLEKAHNQHQPLIQRLRTRSLWGISR
jgi:hypothetical protein